MREGLNDVVILLSVLANVAIGTDCETVKWRRTFLCPLRQGLRQQRQAWNQEQHAFASASIGFGYLQAGTLSTSHSAHFADVDEDFSSASEPVLDWAGISPSRSGCSPGHVDQSC